MKLLPKIGLIIFLGMIFNSVEVQAQKKDKFKIVLDAGHGGKDPGAIGNGYKEKDIALSVVLKTGKILEQYADVEVIYTRKTDVFLTLNERPAIANKANANLFLSVHCNSAKSTSAFGTETIVFGLTNNKSNLEVAKRENSVIFLEEDYHTTYKGFNPNNPESIVGIMLLQDEYINQSISLAGFVQKGYTDKLKRNTRGVKQSSLWVLHQSAMPSILTELGFISNKKEAEYMASEKGQNELAQSLADAVISYKNEHYSYTIPLEQQLVTQPDNKVASEVVIDPDKVVFKIQISASSKKIPLTSQNFKGLDSISIQQSGTIYKYYFGETNDYATVQKLLKQAQDKGYKDAFVVAFKNKEQIKVSDVIK